MSFIFCALSAILLLSLLWRAWTLWLRWFTRIKSSIISNKLVRLNYFFVASTVFFHNSIVSWWKFVQRFFRLFLLIICIFDVIASLNRGLFLINLFFAIFASFQKQSLMVVLDNWRSGNLNRVLLYAAERITFWAKLKTVTLRHRTLSWLFLVNVVWNLWHLLFFKISGAPIFQNNLSQMAASLFSQYLFMTTAFIPGDILIHCSTLKCNRYVLVLIYCKYIFILLTESWELRRKNNWLK